MLRRLLPDQPDNALAHLRTEPLLPFRCAHGSNLSQSGASSNPGAVHSLRATAAINALDHEADIATVLEWLGHANIATTRRYDRRKTRSVDSPTFKVRY